MNKKIITALFIAPFLIHVIIFTFYPAINTLLLSLKQNYSLLTGQYSGFGFDNYKSVFSDKYFIQSICNTVMYAIIVVPLTVFLSIIIAILLNKNIKFKSLFQIAFFLPMVTATTAIAYAWRLMFNSQYGVINNFLNLLGRDGVPWLTSSEYSMIIIIICGVWNMLPFSIITILSSLQSINNNYYIAASIDGAGQFRIFFKITLPAISQNIILLTILNTISSFRVFDELFPLFSGRPGPNYNLYTLVYYIYEQMQSFNIGSYGKAAAAAVVLFLLLLGLSILVFLLKRLKFEKYGG